MPGYPVMRSRGFIFIILFFTPFHLRAQSAVDHWESIINASNTWKYFLGNSEPPASWIINGFDDTSWDEGQGGIGYGDEDDGTTISPIGSVYLRKKFTITDLSILEEVLLLADFDDAFVAYLNGREIARSGINGDRPPYNQFAELTQEARVYQGFYPVEIFFDKTDIDNYFVDGENTLAIQVHNANATSSDLSSNFYLVAGLNTGSTVFQNTPSWFRVPVQYNSSNLPIIKIDTDGRSILDEPKIVATMGIIDNGPGQINHVDDPITDYNGNIGIEIRGSSSQMFPKKQYAVELWTQDKQDSSASVLGFPPEEDWILYAPYSDKSLIRNFLTYNLGEKLGWYAPRTKFVELYLNDQYMGVYVLTEKIKRNKNRVDISKLNPDENSGDDLTGGYIVKIDKTTGAANGDGWNSPFPSIGKQYGIIRFQYHYPREDEITQEQKNYIQQFITDFETALKGPQFRHQYLGYRKYINVESFIDFSIMNELTKNIDGYRLSTFLYKDKDSRDDKLYIGPLWDFNLAFGNADYCNGGDYYGWEWNFNDICGGEHISNPFWWNRLIRDPDYVVQYQSRWNELRQDILSNEKIMDFIDSTVVMLDDPQQRNFERWPILDEYVWPNNYVGGSYTNEISFLKNWIKNRLGWLDSNIANLEIITDINNAEDLTTSITVFPNPTEGAFAIKMNHQSSGKKVIKLQDNLGRIVLQHTLNTQSHCKLNFQIEDAESGIYFLTVFDEQNLLFREKIIIN